MKTKIIYISGAEVFEIRDIRAAFEEVRAALNLDKDTVLFGVPVENDDAGIMAKSDDVDMKVPETEPVEPLDTPVVAAEIVETITEISPAPITELKEEEPAEEIESVIEEEQPVKKRGRPRKEAKVEEITDNEEVAEVQEAEEPEEKVVPILSVLATKEEIDEEPEELEIIPEIAEAEEETVAEVQDSNIDVFDDDDAGLEKLLSAMPPLEEDLLSDQENKDILEENSESSDISVDLTLEKLANEFAENQDKIASEAKSNTRSKIGKLRNILPFKQSKHKDTGLGDLFGWAGIAANDEDFSVPGFFTNVASKK
jgi:hypothetical protein